jgi:F-type H+-transporting ATPase subunit b
MFSLTLLSVAAEHEEATAWGIDAGGWVALAMLCVFGIMIWKGVPKLVAGLLDKQIAEIRKQLDDAKALRAEAETLRNEYAAKIAGAEADATAMVEHARHEADAIVAQASAQTSALIARREKMAQDKIGAAERSALADVRATAARAATAAARGLIAENHDAKADKALVDGAIAGL